MRALYDFAANGDGMLSFAEGQVFSVCAPESQGWLDCELDDNGNKRVGFVPANYVERIN